MLADAPPSAPQRSRIPRGVWMLGFVSLFMDISSEMIHSLLPVFMITVLGLSATAVGLVEGIADVTTYFARLASGYASDRLGKRKLLAVIGYGMAAATKPFFALAPSLEWIIGARFADRLGKGIRGAPRDALIADLSPGDIRGASFGLRQSLDAIGALAGPLVAILLMAWTANDFRFVFWMATLPAAIAVLVLVIAVREPARPPAPTPSAGPAPLTGKLIARLGMAFWGVAGLGALIHFARFSEAFLLLRAQNLGSSAMLVPLVLAILSAVYALAAYPVGRLSDSIGRRGLLIGGFAVLLASHLLLAYATSLTMVYGAAALWGLHLGMTQGLFAALIADTAPPALRGTAFGMFNLLSGVTLLLSSLGAGILWDLVSPRAPFMVGAVLSGAVLLALLTLYRARKRP